MRKILCSPSLTFDSAHVKYGVWTGHYIVVLQRTAKKCTMNYNTRVCSLNLLYSDAAVEIFLGPFHTYPDIFESATFSFRIHNFPCPHVIGFVADLTLESGFKNIRIHLMRVDGSRIPKKKLPRVDGALTCRSVRRPRSHYQSRPFLPDMTDCEVIE